MFSAPNIYWPVSTNDLYVLPPHRPTCERVSYCVETSPPSWLPSQDRSPSLPLLSPFLSFVWCPLSFQREWAAFLGAWCPPPVFKSCFVEVAWHSNDLLMNLWGGNCLFLLILSLKFMHHSICPLFQQMFRRLWADAYVPKIVFWHPVYSRLPPPPNESKSLEIPIFTLLWNCLYLVHLDW